MLHGYLLIFFFLCTCIWRRLYPIKVYRSLQDRVEIIFEVYRLPVGVPPLLYNDYFFRGRVIFCSLMLIYKKLRKTYLAGLIPALLLMGLNLGLVQYSLWQKDADAHLLNIAGRQRMLSQRIALQAVLLRQDQRFTDSLRHSLEKWGMVHAELTRKENQARYTADPEIGLLLNRTAPYLHFARQWYFKQILPGGTPPDLKTLLSSQDQFLALMDAMMERLERQANHRLFQIILLQLLLGIFTLGMVAFLLHRIYKPIFRILYQSLLEAKSNLAKLHSVLNSTSDAHILLDPQGRLLSFNHKAAEVGRRTAGRGMREGDSIYEFITDQRKRRFSQDLQVALQGKIVRREDQIKVGNQLMWFQINLFPVYDEQQKIMGITYNAVNIQEQKEAQIAQNDAEERFRSIVNYAPMMVFILDKNQHITLSNAMAEEVLGYDNSRLEGKKITELLCEWKMLNPGGSNPYGREDFSARALQADGSLLEVEGSLKHFLLLQEAQSILMLRDVSSQKANERHVRRQQSILKDISWLQNHEMRRPVANILSLIHLLKDDADTSFHNHYIKCIETEALSMDIIIHKIVNEVMPGSVASPEEEKLLPEEPTLYPVPDLLPVPNLI